MWFALLTLPCSRDPEPGSGADGTPAVGQTPAAAPATSTPDPDVTTPTADTGGDAPRAPAEVPVSSVPAAASVALDPDLRRCVLEA